MVNCVFRSSELYYRYIRNLHAFPKRNNPNYYLDDLFKNIIVISYLNLLVFGSQWLYLWMTNIEVNNGVFFPLRWLLQQKLMELQVAWSEIIQLINLKMKAGGLAMEPQKVQLYQGSSQISICQSIVCPKRYFGYFISEDNVKALD